MKLMILLLLSIIISCGQMKIETISFNSSSPSPPQTLTPDQNTPTTQPISSGGFIVKDSTVSLQIGINSKKLAKRKYSDGLISASYEIRK
jgi:hypothetical protein